MFGGAGGLALGIQTYLLRDYVVALQGDEAAVGLGLASWLAGIALGALLGRPIARGRPGVTASALFGMLSIAGAVSIVIARLGRTVVHAPVGELLALGPSLVLSLLVFSLPGALVGALFVSLAAAARQHGMADTRAVSRLYVFESIGSLCAGLLVSLVLVPLVSPFRGVAIVIALSVAAAIPAAWAKLLAGRWGLIALLAAAVAASWPRIADRVELATEQARFASLVQGVPLLDFADTPYQHLDVGAGEARSLYASGMYVGSFPDPTEDELRADRLMLLAEHPRRVLALGGLETGTLRFCLQHGVERLDLVTLDRRAFELELRHADKLDRAAVADPRVHVVFDDPRRFLARPGEPYDLVLLLQPDPSTLLLARNTTIEFDRLIARRLAPDGVYVARFAAGPNTQAGETGVLGATLYRTERAVFPVVHAVAEPEPLLVAGTSPTAVTLSPDRLAQRWRSRHISSDVFVPELLPQLFPPERTAALESDLSQAAATAQLSTDDRPASFLHALALRQQVAQSAWAPVLTWAARHPLWLAALSLVPSVLMLGAQRLLRPAPARRLAAFHATAITGACGMAWSLMLFFSFQTRVGALYSAVGALVALFMLGLAVGGAIAARHLSLRKAQVAALLASLVLTAAFLGFGALASWPHLSTALHATLLIVAGIATGGVFPSAAASLLADGGGVRAAASWIELADHAGAAVAALFVAVLLVPVLGLTLAATLMVALQVLVMGAVVLAPRRSGESVVAGG